MNNNDCVVKTEYRQEKYLIWVSALLAVVLLILTFKTAGRFPGDKHIFMVGDYYVQFMNYIVMFWRKLLSGNGLFYSFDVGLGAATWEQYAFYGFSPFNIVFVFIKDTDTAAFVLLLCKAAAIAASMHLFLRYALKLKESLAVIFSVSYAMCAYVMNFYFCIVLIDYLYMLPIVMLMLVRFVKKGRSGGLAAAYAFCFTTAYYGGYMIGVFSFFCFVCMLVYGKHTKEKKKLMLSYIVSVGVAVLISAVVTLPTAVAIMAGHGGDASKGISLKLFIWDIIGNMYPLRRIDESSILPSVYAGLPALFFGIKYFSNRSRNGREKCMAAIPLVFLLLCSIIPPFYLMMHGFDAPNGYHFRFAFLYCFYMIALAAKEVKENSLEVDKIPLAIVAVMYLLVMLLGKISLPADEAGVDTLRMGLVLFFIALYYFIFTSKAKQKTVLVSAVLVLELFANAYFSVTPDKQTLIRWKDTYDLWKYQGDKAVSDINMNETTNDFYRVNYRDGMWNNDSMYFGFHGLGYFSSMEQPEIRLAMKDLGYSTSGRVVVERGGSPFTEMILAQKYRVNTCPNISIDEPDKVAVEKNEFSLPLAFMVSEDITSMENMTDNAFVNQQILAAAMTGHDEALWEEYHGEIDKDCDNADIFISSDEVRIERKDEGTAKITLSLPAKEEKPAYAYFPLQKSAMDWSSPIMSSAAQADNIGIVAPVFVLMTSMLPLGEKEGRSEMYISFRDTTADSTVTGGLHFAYFDRQVLKSIYDELKPGGLEIYDYTDNRIQGKIKAGGDKKIMFTSIPYEKAWHIKIDGKSVESFSVMKGAFLAARVEEGEHEIEIYYDNIYIKAGALISIMGLVMLIILILYDRDIFCKKSQKNFT